jgi:uncharacterized protein (DUF849 family)
MADRAVIIEAALNGATRPQRNPNVPITPEELAADALACIDAGAAIIHQHDAEGGVSAAHTAEQSAAMYQIVLAERPDAICYPTATFLPEIADRWGHNRLLAEAGLIRMAYADPGSLNLGSTDISRPGRASSFVYQNSFADWQHKVDGCEEWKLAPSIACFEPGFVRLVTAYHDAGRLPAGAFTKFYFGGGGPFLFGLPPDGWALDTYLRLIGDRGLPWAVAVLGGDCVASGMAAAAVERGGHIRVGLEDHDGADRPTNVELVHQAVAVIEDAGCHPATPADAATLLGMPG